jgi:hypothetical protein
MSEMQPIQRGKLSKKFFMELDEGLYLVSNVGENPLKPIFAELMVPLNVREEQWKRIRSKNVNNILCEVFPSKDIFEQYNLSRFSNMKNKKDAEI